MVDFIADDFAFAVFASHDLANVAHGATVAARRFGHDGILRLVGGKHGGVRADTHHASVVRLRCHTPRLPQWRP